MGGAIPGLGRLPLVGLAEILARPDIRAFLAMPVMGAVVALPLRFGGDLAIGSRILFVDRASQLAGTIAAGLWLAVGMPRTQAAIVAAGLVCWAMIFIPKPAYSVADVAMCLAVAFALFQLVADQQSIGPAIQAVFALCLLLVDRVLMQAVCGTQIGWRFLTHHTACGEAWGDARAMVPSLLALAAWLAVAAWTGRS